VRSFLPNGLGSCSRREKREYELVYHGKDREEDIIADTLAVPLQPVRTFGRNGDDWHNSLIFGDNLQAMKTLLEMKRHDIHVEITNLVIPKTGDSLDRIKELATWIKDKCALDGAKFPTFSLLSAFLPDLPGTFGLFSQIFPPLIE
jgi:hypothetical protein